MDINIIGDPERLASLLELLARQVRDDGVGNVSIPGNEGTELSLTVTGEPNEDILWEEE